MSKGNVFLDVKIGLHKRRRIEFELFDNLAPRTCENFRSLCTGEKGNGKRTNLPLHYQDCPFHRIIAGFMAQGGDFENRNGTGGESIYGGKFEDEKFEKKHDKPYLLSMANAGPNTNGSQFFVTFAPAPWLDGKHVVFGEAVSGHKTIQKMEKVKTGPRDRPLEPVTIVDCGVVSDASDDSSDNGVEHSRSSKQESGNRRSRSPRGGKDRSDRMPKDSSKKRNDSMSGSRERKDGEENREGSPRSRSPVRRERMDEDGRVVKGRGSLQFGRRGRGGGGRYGRRNDYDDRRRYGRDRDLDRDRDRRYERRMDEDWRRRRRSYDEDEDDRDYRRRDGGRRRSRSGSRDRDGHRRRRDGSRERRRRDDSRERRRDDSRERRRDDSRERRRDDSRDRQRRNGRDRRGGSRHLDIDFGDDQKAESRDLQKEGDAAAGGSNGENEGDSKGGAMQE